MYHSSGISSLGRRAAAPNSTSHNPDDLDPVIHTFSSFLFSRNEKALQKKVHTLTRRLQHKEAIISSLRALLITHQTPSTPIILHDSTASAPSIAVIQRTGGAREQEYTRCPVREVTSPLSVVLLSDDEVGLHKIPTPTVQRDRAVERVLT